MSNGLANLPTGIDTPQDELAFALQEQYPNLSFDEIQQMMIRLQEQGMGLSSLSQGNTLPTPPPFVSTAGQKAELERLQGMAGMYGGLGQQAMAGRGGWASPMMAFVGQAGMGRALGKGKKARQEILGIEEERAKYDYEKANAWQKYLTSYKKSLIPEVNDIFKRLNDGTTANDDEALAQLQSLVVKTKTDVGDDFGLGNILKQYMERTTKQMARKPETVQNVILQKVARGEELTGGEQRIYDEMMTKKPQLIAYYKMLALSPQVDEEVRSQALLALNVLMGGETEQQETGLFGLGAGKTVPTFPTSPTTEKQPTGKSIQDAATEEARKRGLIK